MPFRGIEMGPRGAGVALEFSLEDKEDFNRWRFLGMMPRRGQGKQWAMCLGNSFLAPGDVKVEAAKIGEWVKIWRADSTRSTVCRQQSTTVQLALEEILVRSLSQQCIWKIRKRKA